MILDGAGVDVTAWSGVTAGRRLRGGNRSEVWAGTAAGDPVVIRRSRREPASLQWELDLLRALDAAGFDVPVPLSTDLGLDHADGVVVQRWIGGTEPATREDWTAVALELRRLHETFAGRPQRPGCCVVTALGRTGRSVDADLSRLPGDVVEEILGVFASVEDVRVSVIHGDPNPSNIRMTEDGGVALLDWDESRVDLIYHDLSELGVQVLADEEHHRAACLSDAWEAANAWIPEPEYARARLESLRSRRLRQ